MWVTKLLISPVKKLAFFVNLGQAMQADLVPCWWLWRAGCISQDTFYFISDKDLRVFKIKQSVH